MIDYIGDTKVGYREERTVIRGAGDVYNELREYAGKKQEHFFAIYLNSSMEVIETRVVFIGSLDQSIAVPREVFAPAVEKRAASIIIAHNHPSGNLQPSEADKRVTERFKEAGKILGIDLLDHLIIGEHGYFSFQAENLIL